MLFFKACIREPNAGAVADAFGLRALSGSSSTTLGAPSSSAGGIDMVLPGSRVFKVLDSSGFGAYAGGSSTLSFGGGSVFYCFTCRVS